MNFDEVKNTAEVLETLALTSISGGANQADLTEKQDGPWYEL